MHFLWFDCMNLYWCLGRRRLFCVSELIALTVSMRYLSFRTPSFGLCREGCRSIWCLVLPQVLVLTHELSDAASWDMGAYSSHFWPVKPTLLYGRPAKLAPECPVNHCVWYGWRDIGVSKSTTAIPTG